MNQPNKISTLVVLGVVCCGMAYSSQAQSTTIINETFTAPNGTTLSGLTPDQADYPGSKWTDTTYYNPSIQNNILNIGADSGATISLASAGGYVKPASLTESVTFKMNTDTYYGVGVGFSSVAVTVTNGNYHSNFTGFNINNAGTLTLLAAGIGLGSVAWSGGSAFSPAQYYTLSYSLNTANGSVSGIALSGSTANYSPLVTNALNNDAFSGPQTAYVEIWGQGGSGGNQALFSNVSVSTTAAVSPVPEPGSLALGSIGLAGLIAARRRHGK